MNPKTSREATKLARAIDAKNVVICPSFPFLGAVKKAIKKARLGSQDVFWEEKGAYTGEVSPAMLKNSGIEYVIVGHSERRRWLNETDEMINKKVLATLRAGLKVILCVGEPLIVRRQGLAAAKKYVKSQLQKDLSGISNLKPKTQNLIIAYEPIWAIGTGRSDKPEETFAMAKFIKQFLHSKFYILNSKVLYGGSVNSKNVWDFVKYKEIDGALVGGASLNAKEFRKIIKRVRRLR